MPHDTFRYTASARLGVWGSIPINAEEFVYRLESVLRANANATLESESHEFVPTDNDQLGALLSVMDKIVLRGNPTLIDPEFENRLLSDENVCLMKTKAFENSQIVGTEFNSLSCEGSPADLITTAEFLSNLPYSDDTGWFCQQPLSSELKSLCSEEEDQFFAGFSEAFSRELSRRLRRQVLIRDLVEHIDDALANNRVDFALQVSSLKWIFEIDGPQHGDTGQEQHDRIRDEKLQSCGWTVHRVKTEVVHNNLTGWFETLRSNLSAEAKNLIERIENQSIRKTIIDNQAHRAALNTVLFPLAVHRCLRGIIQLFLHDMIPIQSSARILAIEEDLEVVTEAFYQLSSMWRHFTALSSLSPIMPKIHLHVIGGTPLLSVPSDEWLLHEKVEDPDGDYDLVISHSLFLMTGDRGPLEQAHFQSRPANFVAMRSAIGLKEERQLLISRPLVFDLADIENALLSQDTENKMPLPAHKHEALLYFLKYLFRKLDFWDGQLRVVSRLLQGKPAVVLLPTGGGKSLTYQFSGLLLPGMTIVIDPLVSLMNDQVENLLALGIDLVNSISGQQAGPAERDAVMKEMTDRRLAFIFISPERLQIKAFRESLLHVAALCPISLAVIDEAHCVSEWGHDFRPSYLHMPRNLKTYCSHAEGRSPTLVGLTGTASFAVLTDIQIEMGIKDEEAIILPRSFDRKELVFDVHKSPMASKQSKLKTIKELIPIKIRANPHVFYDLRGDRTNGGIVFCPHVNGSLGVVQVAGSLNNNNFFAGQKPTNFRGDSAAWNEYKLNVQRKFKRNKIQELVATKSFGMGIDKPNVRYTIHYAMPQSVESFYQEAGRAGRNGKPKYAYCSIIYSDDNWDSALEILNEPDHGKALTNLNGVNWNDRGDLLVLLWLLFNSYGGKEKEKTDTIDFWEEKLWHIVEHLAPGATNTAEIGFSDRNRATYERSIFRLMLLGVVQDYTIDWHLRKFEVKVQKISPKDIKSRLKSYLLQYKFEEFAKNAILDIPEDSVQSTLRGSVYVLTDFVYDEIVTKRKQALRTMGELCREFQSDQYFREAILAYLQESEFSDQLKTWVNKSFDQIKLDQIDELLQKVTSLEEAKRLVGTTRRLLDEDPQNIALRYLSMCARAISAVESDTSVIQEATPLATQIERNREQLINANDILFRAMLDIKKHRPKALEEISRIFLRRAGSAEFSRYLLRHSQNLPDALLKDCLVFLESNIMDVVRTCSFYRTV